MIFEIFRKEFGGYFNYFFINLILPKIRIGKKEESFSDTEEGSALLDKLLTPQERAILKKMREDGKI